MRDFTRLVTWEKAHELVLAIYQATSAFPHDERFGITAQTRRSAASIPANIAEGAGRRTDADFARFVDIALGSANETEYHLILARDLGITDTETHNRLSLQLAEMRKMLTSLARRLRADSHRTRDN